MNDAGRPQRFKPHDRKEVLDHLTAATRARERFDRLEGGPAKQRAMIAEQDHALAAIRALTDDNGL